MTTQAEEVDTAAQERAARGQSDGRGQSPYTCPVEGCEKNKDAGFFGYALRRDLSGHLVGAHRDMKLSTATMDFGGGVGADSPGWEWVSKRDLKRQRNAGAGKPVDTVPIEGLGKKGADAPASSGGAAAQTVATKIAAAPVSERPPNSLGATIPTGDPMALESVRDRLEAVARQLGIPATASAAMANYVSGSFDVNDPDAVWEALTQVTEIIPSMKKRLWRTWCSFMGITPPAELAKAIDEQVEAAIGKSPMGRPKSGRLFTAVNGEVYPTDDPDVGLSWAQAMQQANLQIQSRPQGGPDQEVSTTGAMVVEMIRQGAEDRRFNADLALKQQDRQIELAKTGQQPQTESPLVRVVLDLAQRNNDAKVELVKESTNNAIELVKLQLATQGQQMTLAITELTKAVTAIATRPAGPLQKPFIEQLFEEVPGAKQRFFDALLGTGQQSREPFVIKLPEGDVGLETWEKIEEIKSKREGRAMMRENIPQLFDLGRDMIASWDRMNANGNGPNAGAGGAGQENGTEEQLPANMQYSNCIKCNLQVRHNKGIRGFVCPACNTAQSPGPNGQAINISDPAGQAKSSATEKAGSPPSTAMPASPSDPPSDPPPTPSSAAPSAPAATPPPTVATQPRATKMTESENAKAGVPA